MKPSLIQLGGQAEWDLVWLNRGAGICGEVQSPGMLMPIGAKRRLTSFWRRFFLPVCWVICGDRGLESGMDNGAVSRD